MAEATAEDRPARESRSDRERRLRTYVYNGRGTAYRTEGVGLKSKQVALRKGETVKMLPEEAKQVADRFIPAEQWERGQSHVDGARLEARARQLEERERKMAEREREIDEKIRRAEEAEERVRLAERPKQPQPEPAKQPETEKAKGGK